MIRIRPSAARGQFRNAWLDARFTFSFGDYRDPAYDGYSDLLVLNDDRVAPGGGFAEHGHRDMEVMSYPLAGAVEHRDTLGNVALMRPGDVHLMRAGTGIRHSEMNASASKPEHHLQWWIRPFRAGLQPSYARIHVPAREKANAWRLLASPEPASGALEIAQDARVFAALLGEGRLEYRPPAGRKTYAHIACGQVLLNGQPLGAGDGVFAEEERLLEFAAVAPGGGEVLLFDLRAI